MFNPIDATHASKSVNPETYGFIPTRTIVDRFESKGWNLVDKKIAKVRDAERDGFQKHLLFFESDSFKTIPGLSANHESRPRICVLNSHDATTALRVMLGLIKLACLNGIIAGLSLKDIRVVHSQRMIRDIDSALDQMIDSIPILTGQIQEMARRRFDADSLARFQREMIDARLADVNVKSVSYTVPTLRYQDSGNDVFTEFNRVQELIMRGGIQYVGERRVDVGKPTERTIEYNGRTRRLNSIGQSVSLNRLAYDRALALSEPTGALIQAA